MALFFSYLKVYGQDTLRPVINDTTIIITDTVLTAADKFGIDSKVDYQAEDSLIFDISTQKVFLYRNSEINYETTNLKAAFVEIDFTQSLLYATFMLDSLNKEYGKPLFTEGGQSFSSKEMNYNFNTKQGLIKDVITQEGDGYIHGRVIKKMKDDIINIKSGSYTTCSNENPHFEMRFHKAKVIPGNKIVTGPAYLVVEDVPLPIAVPFGMFPIFKGRTSGIIIPSYGESASRGFYFHDFGYYWGISDYIDLTVLGDIYTRGSWALKPNLSYKKRYKFGGNFNFNFGVNRAGVEGTPDYELHKDFAIRWNHTQDPKAKPNSSFSASVNIVTGQYNRYNPVSATDYLSNTFSSSISYQKHWAGKYHLTLNLNHSQNTIQHTIDLGLPKVSFNINRFFPFRRKQQVGKLKWYENISVNYSMNAENRINTLDTLLFNENVYKDFKNGMKHYIPISSSVKLLKFFNLTNSINYTERWYSQRIEKYWTNDTLISNGDTVAGYVKNDTIYGFQTARDFNFSSSINTRLYGMLQFKKGPVRAIRHVMTPSVSFSIRPDFGAEKFGYWDYYYTNETQTDSVRHSVFQGSIYGTPPDRSSGNLSFSLSNNLEIKVRSKKDTITGMKKIVLIDNFSITTSYDLAKDSLNWAPISMSGRTTLFKGFNILFNGRWDLYALDDSTGRRINTFVWEQSRKLLRFENTIWNLSFRYSFSSKRKTTPKPSNFGTQEEKEEIMENFDQFLDWNNPWKLSFNYNFRYTHRYDPTQKANTDDIVQTLGFNGDVSVTEKWKIGFTSGYDFEDGAFSYTSLNLYRDLHCWEMRFSWIPTGYQKSWNFSINAKSPLLQDLKLQKKKDFRDNLF
ncbi:MAG: LPS-assembly protein LptD [Bacteroidales bacterium]|nr:LPS-assembly protein LptD [Bacteroidales bacterium]